MALRNNDRLGLNGLRTQFYILIGCRNVFRLLLGKGHNARAKVIMLPRQTLGTSDQHGPIKNIAFLAAHDRASASMIKNALFTSVIGALRTNKRTEKSTHGFVSQKCLPPDDAG